MRRRLPPFAPHGGPQWAGDDPPDDFSTSTNPFGPPDELRRVLRNAAPDRYPPLDDGELRSELGAGFAVHPDRIVIGAGTAELIYRLSAVLLSPGDTVLVGEPAFPEYARAAHLHGARTRRLTIDPPGGPPNARPLLDALSRGGVRLVWVGQPGNPSGRALRDEDLRVLAAAARRAGALLVIDAAYRPLSTAHLGFLPRSAVVLHSVTKAWGIPGLRVGWLEAPPALARRLRLAAPPWPIGQAEVAALRWIASPQSRTFVDDSRPRVLALAEDLRERLRRAGAAPEPSAAGYLLVPTPAGGVEGARAAGFALRPIGVDRVRIAVRSPTAHARLADWWRTR